MICELCEARDDTADLIRLQVPLKLFNGPLLGRSAFQPAFSIDALSWQWSWTMVGSENELSVRMSIAVKLSCTTT